MIRFIDLTECYPAEFSEDFYARCAFINTIDDTFIEDDCGCHTFIDMGEVLCIPDESIRERCKQLVPEGFFSRRKKGDTATGNRSKTAID